MMLRSTLLFALLLCLVAGCKKSDPGAPATPAPAPDLGSARFTGFVLNETAYTTIQIDHPAVAGGVETAEGTIRVVVPAATANLQLTPRTSNFVNDNFTVSPALGTVQDFTNPVLYTITSKTDASKKVHYRVAIVRETPGGGGGGGNPLAVTGFRFESAKNPQLAADVTASEILFTPGSLGKIYIFLPAGTNFGSLRPTVSFNGTSLVYSQDPQSPVENSTTVYPAAGIDIDFAYPKHFYLAVKDANGSKVYEVIADVRAPLRIDDAAAAVNGVNFGNTALRAASRVVNVGNHALSVGSITHSDAQPAQSTALRGVLAFNSGGLLPGQSAVVNANVNGINNPPGNYTVTASFLPRIVNNEEASPYLLPAQISLSTTIGN
ncbi:MAG: hypothetical protein EOO16_19570 [Chitinophagaceae bacterium]|nr:MAG: hypothetical protein EOO16_19570 [Chitinophagaceae bacterium]